MKKLSKSQFQALHRMPNSLVDTRSCYDLRTSIATMNALQTKGLVISFADVGYFTYPRTSIQWRLTSAGLKYRKDTRHLYAE